MPRFLNTSHSSGGQVAGPANVYINIAEVILMADDVLDISLLLVLPPGLDIIPVVSVVRSPVTGRLDQPRHSLTFSKQMTNRYIRFISLTCLRDPSSWQIFLMATMGMRMTEEKVIIQPATLAQVGYV